MARARGESRRCSPAHIPGRASGRHPAHEGTWAGEAGWVVSHKLPPSSLLHSGLTPPRFQATHFKSSPRKCVPHLRVTLVTVGMIYSEKSMASHPLHGLSPKLDCIQLKHIQVPGTLWSVP